MVASFEVFRKAYNVVSPGFRLASLRNIEECFELVWHCSGGVFRSRSCRINASLSKSVEMHDAVHLGVQDKDKLQEYKS